MPCLSRTFCCIAIPIYRTGIYLVLLETFVAGVTIGTLCLAGPTIQAAAIPSFGSTLLAVFCIATGLFQLVGFWAIIKDRRKAFSLFQTLNLCAQGLTFLLAAVWIILSGVRHNTAVNSCMTLFSASSSSSAKNICNIFCFIQVGIMAFVWFFFFFVQGYFCLVHNVYGNVQRKDRSKYDDIYFAAEKPGLHRLSSHESLTSLEGPFPPTHQYSASLSSLRYEVAPEPSSLTGGAYSDKHAGYELDDMHAYQTQHQTYPQDPYAYGAPRTQEVHPSYTGYHYPQASHQQEQQPYYAKSEAYIVHDQGWQQHER